MNHQDEFYMVLPSNVENIPGSSTENRPDEYRTPLPQPIEVANRKSGKWRWMGLTVYNHFERV